MQDAEYGFFTMLIMQVQVKKDTNGFFALHRRYAGGVILCPTKSSFPCMLWLFYLRTTTQYSKVMEIRLVVAQPVGSKRW
mmetsp:Transcript_20538/g.56984  ORF Transcript_20538/g.56984 Transcript_20538/m.56984 type:complete len:80 (+) Transcript_20538:786-1025(+)